MLGITQGQPLGVDEAIVLAGRLVEIVQTKDRAPILFLVDSASQRMSKRDELLGLSEYLSHLAKALLLAEAEGHRTVGLLYGGSAAGAFIATALAAGTLVALPGAHPAVMDLPSMAGSQASDRRLESQGRSHAGVRARARQHGADRRHSRRLG